MHTGRWQGELVQSKNDSAQVLVSSRWSLHLDERGMPVVILQANTDLQLVSGPKKPFARMREKRFGEVKSSFVMSSKPFLRLPGRAGQTGRMNSFIGAGKNIRAFPLRKARGLVGNLRFIPTTSTCYVAKLDASLANGDEYDDEIRLRRKDGEYRWFLVCGVPLRDDQGSMLKWYGTLTDIEDRKLAEERLRNENVVLREEVDKASMFEEVVGTCARL
jgi:hypothetical protein